LINNPALDVVGSSSSLVRNSNEDDEDRAGVIGDFKFLEMTGAFFDLLDIERLPAGTEKPLATVISTNIIEQGSSAANTI
jgi:hypothetical protein